MFAQVSNQLISLASREGNIHGSDRSISRSVSNQLISLASREFWYFCVASQNLTSVSNQLISLASREGKTPIRMESKDLKRFQSINFPSE